MYQRECVVNDYTSCGTGNLDLCTSKATPCLGDTGEAKRGFSLVEIMITMFVLAIFVMVFTKGLTYAKYTAEDNLYSSTALTVAVSTIEQMKGANLNLLSSPRRQNGKEIFTMVVEGGNDHDLILDEVNNITIPLVTDENNEVAKTLDLEITPSIEPMSTFTGYWLTIRYSYKHPQTGRVKTEIIRNARSTVSI